MEKSSSPLKNTENVGGKTLMEKHMPEEKNSEHLEILYEKLPEKVPATPTHVMDSKAVKLKKLKINESRGEKRKFLDKSDTLKKFKRKKKEKLENFINSKENILTDSCIDSVLPAEEAEPSTPEDNTTINKEDSIVVENESDMENKKFTKQKPSRKNKAIANKCKETLDILLKYNSSVLESLDNSMKIINSHNFLNNKYISVEILSDLISLALETSRKSAVVDFEKELSLLMIINKCTTKLCVTPKTSRFQQSLAAVPVSPKDKSQEEVVLSTPTSKEEVLERGTPRSQILEEPMEYVQRTKAEFEKPCETSTIELNEKNQELAVEKSGKNFCITNYFKKLKKTVEERDKNERFSCFMTKTDMFLAPKLGGELTGQRRRKFEEDFSRQNAESNYLAEHSSKSKNFNKETDNSKQENESNLDIKNTNIHSSNEPSEVSEIYSPDGVESSEVPKSEQTKRKRVSLIRVDKPKGDPIEAVGRTKAKLFQFHDNRRPPYWGTWRKKSESVGPRRPFGKDKSFNYEIDSDDEWEEEEEPGESLHGSDDEKEPEEDYEVDNDFFVPHGYLSDDENPEKENLSSKKKLDLLEEQFTSEQKQKTRKMTPIVFGTFWVHKGSPSEGNLYQDLQIEKLQYVPWTTVPIEIEEDEKKNENLLDTSEASKKYKKKAFPDEEIPHLIKMIHGSPQNSNHLARKFLLYWETEKTPSGDRRGLTKACVQNKIRELAAWQAGHEKGKMCWFVPKETREEFGAEVENKTPEKKPQKCFFWKFVRKAEKNPEGESSPPPAPAPAPSPAPSPSIEPEVVILES